MRLQRKGWAVELETRRATFFVGRLGRGVFVGKADRGVLERRLMESFAQRLEENPDHALTVLFRKVDELKALYVRKIAAENQRREQGTWDGRPPTPRPGTREVPSR